MALLSDLLNTLPDGDVSQVIIGLHWTAVVTEVEDHRHCGLATTSRIPHEHHSELDVPDAGQLETSTGLGLTDFAHSDSPIMRSVGVAAINALLPPLIQDVVDTNAEEVIASHGFEKRVVLVGRFPFIPRLRTRVGELTVLELNPNPGELPETAAQDVIPAADVVAITGLTLINHSLENLLKLCSPQARIILLGPSTPLSPVLFDYGVDLLCGSIVTDIEPVLRAVSQGANFRQVHRAGVRLISVARAEKSDI
jgi:uncharacterized protein (DUF4213/DUF364 family)